MISPEELCRYILKGGVPMKTVRVVAHFDCLGRSRKGRVR